MQKEKKSQLSFMRPLLQGALLGFLLILGFIGCNSLFDSKRFPVTAVTVIGDLQFQDKHQIENILLKELSKGFYGLSVNQLKKTLLNLSWIERTEVKRLWPETIQINLLERKPCVIWNKTSFISDKGELFDSSHSQKGQGVLENLPKLHGPKGRHGLVWQNYLVMEKVLESIDLKISELALSPRGSWEIKLENNTKIILGTREVLARLRRFIRIYDKLMMQQPHEIAYVDLRYTSGMAVAGRG